jgi:prepilin-type N-terminal cleavage/methylation domain-containing protein
MLRFGERNMHATLGSRRGFTLIEMAISLAIIGILTGIGIWMSSNMLPTWRTRAAALQFSSHVQQCRALAVRSNAECRILMVDYDTNLNNLEVDNVGEYWIALGNLSNASDTWDLLPPDMITDSSDDDTSQGKINIGPGHEHYMRYVGLDDWGDGSLGGPNFGNNNAIVFGPRGFVTNPASDFNGEGYIEITFVNKFARSEGQQEDYIVKITRSGMTRVDTSINDDFDNLWAGTAQNSSAP